MGPEYTNIFHTLRSNMGIKEYEQNLVFKYHYVLHRYVHVDMDCFNISSLESNYRDVIKIEKIFK
jgi:hypothetical protein